jgi:hypothetical protein
MDLPEVRILKTEMGQREIVITVKKILFVLFTPFCPFCFPMKVGRRVLSEPSEQY